MIRTAALLGAAAAQNAGTVNDNDLMPFPIGECTKDGCTVADTKLSLDSNWRWTHKAGDTENCYTNNTWVNNDGDVVCEDGATQTCGKECAVGGWPEDQWEAPYGVNKTANGVKLGYVTEGPYSTNVGTRLFVTENGKYKQFDLIGKEVSVVVDMSRAECGLNGAIYFVEMDPDGDKGVDTNKAGAEYGTGYCDAQCPRDLKWIKGKANIKPEWVPIEKDPNKNIGEGGRGICCVELDLWEANKISMQQAIHPVDEVGQIVCEWPVKTPGAIPCGSQSAGERDIGPTDRNGCYINPYFMGHKKFYGPGTDFTINTKKPFGIVTEFREKDGHLDNMVQYYYQGGKKIMMPDLGYGSDNGMSQDSCKKILDRPGEAQYFFDHGGMPQFSKAVENGLTMVLSFWDDMATNMNWLDTGERGSCDVDAGDPATLRVEHPDARFDIRHMRWGPIGTTHGALAEALRAEELADVVV